jgi:integrase
MPRQSKPPRLYLKREQRNASGQVTHAATWIIIDGGRQFGTGCGPLDTAGAEKALAAYIGGKYTEAATAGPRPTNQIPVADVLALYARDKMPKHARPENCRYSLKKLGAFFAKHTLADINGVLCQEYIRQASTKTMARCDLEVLRAAINYHRRQGLHDRIVSVVMPDRPPARQRWLTVAEAAHLVHAAYRYRVVQQGNETIRWTRRHIARFTLIALYTGSRATTVMQASFVKEPGRPFIDLETGMFYRRPEGEAETIKRRPTIKLPRPLLAHLRRWHRMGARYAVEWGGKPIQRITMTFNQVVADAGLGRDVTPHILRHTAATWMLQNGTPLREAAGYLGMSQAVLERVYGHHHPDHMESARNAFDRRRRPKNQTPTAAIPSTVHQR